MLCFWDLCARKVLVDVLVFGGVCVFGATL